MRRVVLALAACACLALGAGLAAAARLPTPAELPPQTVARVTHAPAALGTVTRKELKRLIAQQAAAAKRPVPSPGQPAYERLAAAALDETLDVIDIHGQALEMGIVATGPQIAAELARIKRENFKSEADYRRFLRETKFTVKDIRLRVRAQVESNRIQEQVIAGLDGGAKAIQKGYGEWVEAYVKRWRERTVCTPAYATPRCSNGPSRSGADQASR